MKRLILLLVAMLSLSAFLVACGNTNTITVTTNASNFAQSSVTLAKGQSLQVHNTASDTHLLGLGRWNNGMPQPEQESGAPQVNDVYLNLTFRLNRTKGPPTLRRAA